MQNKRKKTETVLVAMSGGVDSSVVAAILKKRGYNVIGLTMQIWQESQRDPRHSGCCSLGAVEDARRVARILDIPHYVINFKDAFRQNVIDHFIDEYAAGRTPNPCVECNRKVKFDALLEKMKELDCDRLATGHYARIRYDLTSNRYKLMRARSKSKDQSYVLYMLSQDQLSKLYFPLGELSGKNETRELAHKFHLPVANKPDSQEICFVSEAGGYAQFLRKEKPELFNPGKILDQDGKEMGAHEGVIGFTVGQRRGIRAQSKDGRPLYVLRLDPKDNHVVVGKDEDLLRNEVVLENMIWSSKTADQMPIRIEAKIRYNMPSQKGTLYANGQTKLVFDEPVRAVTPGQIAVAYKGETVVGGGIISTSL